jgi:hypothetical protein
MKLLLSFKTMIFSIITIAIINITGCGLFDSEKGIEKDRNEQKEILNGLFVTYWKGAKISIRSMPIDKNTKTIDFYKIKQQQAKDLKLGKHLRRIYDWEMILRDVDVEEREIFTAKEFMEFAKEVYTMADAIESLDEDTYPTFAEIIQHSSRVLQKKPIQLPKDWNNSMDHWMFALAMESRFGFGSWKTYELEKVHPQDLITSDYRVFASLHKGIDHLRNKWYFLSDESFSQAIAESNNPSITLQDYTKNLIVMSKNNNFSPEEQFKLITRASSYLLRGFSRHNADSIELNEKALEDIEAAIVDFHSLGIENELVWIAESYLYIKNEEKENAIASLSKLEASNYLTDKERELLIQAKEKIRNRNPDSALNLLTDKIIIYKLGLSYTMSYASEIQWMQLLEKTEQGKRILKRFTELKQIFKKGKDYLDLDKLKEKGQTLFKELVE